MYPLLIVLLLVIAFLLVYLSVNNRSFPDSVAAVAVVALCGALLMGWVERWYVGYWLHDLRVGDFLSAPQEFYIDSNAARDTFTFTVVGPANPACVIDTNIIGDDVQTSAIDPKHFSVTVLARPKQRNRRYLVEARGLVIQNCPVEALVDDVTLSTLKRDFKGMTDSLKSKRAHRLMIETEAHALSDGRR